MVPLTFRLVITEEIRVFQQYRSTCGIRHFAPNDWGGSQAEIQTKPLPKLLVRFFIGGRDGDCAKWFMDDLAARMANRRPAYERRPPGLSRSRRRCLWGRCRLCAACKSCTVLPPRVLRAAIAPQNARASRKPRTKASQIQSTSARHM